MEFTDEEIKALRLEASRVLGISEAEAGRELNEFGFDALKVVISFTNSAQEMRNWIIETGKGLCELEEGDASNRKINNMYKVGSIAASLILVSFPPNMRDKIAETAMKFANAQNKDVDDKYNDLVDSDGKLDLDSLLDEVDDGEEEKD